MRKCFVNAEEYTNDGCYFHLLRSCPSMNTDTLHKKYFLKITLYSSISVYCKSINYLLVVCYRFIFSIHVFTVVISK